MKDLGFTTPNLMSLLHKENRRQLEKWGVEDRSSAEWLMFATEELGETAKAIGEFQFRGGLAEDVVKEAIQTATLCLKIAEMFQGVK